jgi:ATP-binding cassette subfamily B (MDR/TAP) protein 1
VGVAKALVSIASLSVVLTRTQSLVAVIALTERFYDPTEGIVRLDGHDLKTLNVKWLRRQIGLVSQEPTLFGVSIRQNIEHGLIGSRFENVSDAEKFELVKQAAVQANAHDFIMNLPAGYDTDVGERGFLISGGQKQRVAIARSIVSDPKILLLDEATSALDTQSEGIVQEALERASVGRTTIVIAHRLSTIKVSRYTAFLTCTDRFPQNADNIVVVGSGEILEQGTHNQLLANPDSAYAQLVKAQELTAQKEKATSFDDDDSLEGQEATNGKTITGGDSTSGSDLKREETRLSGKNGELPAGLERKNTQRSIASEVLASRAAEEGQQDEKEKLYSFFYLAKRCYKINREYKMFYAGGLLAAIGSGMVYPAIAILFGYVWRSTIWILAHSFFQLFNSRLLRHRPRSCGKPFG